VSDLGTSVPSYILDRNSNIWHKLYHDLLFIGHTNWNFSIMLKRTNRNLYDLGWCIYYSVSYWNWPIGISMTLGDACIIEYHARTIGVFIVWPCIILKHSVSYSNIQYHTRTFRVVHFRTKRSKLCLSMIQHDTENSICMTLYHAKWFSMILNVSGVASFITTDEQLQ